MYRVTRAGDASRGAPILFPFPNGVPDGRFRFRGHDHTLELNERGRPNHIHGFARDLPWAVEDAGASVPVPLSGHRHDPWFPATLGGMRAATAVRTSTDMRWEPQRPRDALDYDDVFTHLPRRSDGRVEAQVRSADGTTITVEASEAFTEGSWRRCRARRARAARALARRRPYQRRRLTPSAE